MISMPELYWHLHPFPSLSTMQLYAILAARSAVFVVEQRCSYQDMDSADEHCSHLIAWDRDHIAAYLRIVPPGVKFDEPSIGRVLTSRTHRGGGLGKELMRRGLNHFDQLYPASAARIGAQAHLQKFYGEFGFRTVSDIYLEDAIEHVYMLRPQPGTSSIS